MGCCCSFLSRCFSRDNTQESSNLIDSESNSRVATDGPSSSQRETQYSGGYNFVSSDGPSAGGDGGASNFTKPKKAQSSVVTDSGLFSPSRTGTSLSRSQSVSSAVSPAISSQKGSDLHAAIKEAYRLKDNYSTPTPEFLAKMDKLFMECQIHLSDLSAATHSINSNQREADFLVDELIALRNHWGPQLLPTSVCNAFVRERIEIDLGLQRYRVDCAEFFEPVPYYSQSVPNTGDLVKIYRFSVYDVSRNEVILRYFLERSHVRQIFHALCYSQPEDNKHGQVHPYGTECPSYWTVRSHVISDMCKRFQLETVKN